MMASVDLLRRLRVFVAVAEEGHFGHAADRLGMTQPPVSQGVRRLEGKLGVTLLTRTARGVGLTSAGAELLPRATALLADNDAALTVSAYDPAFASATTARDMTRLLSLIWSDAIVTPEQCAFMRRLLGMQVWAVLACRRSTREETHMGNIRRVTLAALLGVALVGCTTAPAIPVAPPSSSSPSIVTLRIPRRSWRSSGSTGCGSDCPQ